jgi:hypothetical protein
MDHTARFHWMLTTQPPYNDLPGVQGDDSFEWMHARKVLWPLSHTPSTMIAFTSDQDPMMRHGIWQAVIDLLMYGNGWLNLAGELRSWRKNRYEQTNDIFAFVFQNFRELLLPLETYFAVHNWANGHMASYLNQDLDYRALEDLLEPRPVGNTDALIRKCKDLNLDRSSISYDLVQALPQSARGDHDGDPLHISPHFTFDWTQAEPELAQDDVVVRVSDDLGTVKFANYGHWYRKAHDLTNQWRDELMARSTKAGEHEYWMHIDVHINGIGFLGRFARVGPDNRLRRVSPTDTSLTVKRDRVKTSPTKIETAPMIRYSDVPPALQKLMLDMISKVEAKIGPDADDYTDELKTFISGSDYYSQSEISSQMAKLLRLLT